MNKSNVLVLGAHGFVGRHTLQALAACDDVAPIAGVRRHAALSAEADVRLGDLRSIDDVKRMVRGVDTVVLAAAWSSLVGHAEQSDVLYRQPLLQAIDVAVDAGVRRVVFVSAVHVHHLAHSPHGVWQRAPQTAWPHVANVVAVEEHLRRIGGRDLPQAVSVRLGPFVGPGVGMGLVPLLVPRLQRRLVPHVGDGEARLHFIGGEDVGDAMATAATCALDDGFHAFDATGPASPSFNTFYAHLHDRWQVPQPWFRTSLTNAYRAARFFEWWAGDRQPLLSQSTVFLGEDVDVDVTALRALGHRPHQDWRALVDAQVAQVLAHPSASMWDATPAPVAMGGKTS